MTPFIGSYLQQIKNLPQFRCRHNTVTLLSYHRNNIGIKL